MADTYTPREEIAALVANVNKAAAGFEVASEGTGFHTARRNIQREARKLLYSLEEPNTEVWPRTFQVRLLFL
jgi:hypothetical protein